MNNSWLTYKNRLSLSISLIIHIFIIAITYFIKSPSQNLTYHKKAQYTLIKIESKRTYVAEQKSLVPCTISAKNKPLEHTKKHVKQKNVPLKKPSTVAKSTFKVDQRAVYKNIEIDSKQAGAILELSGWKWDMVPNPEDTTEEFGKIVFEIKVDENGEIISLQSIEKTVSPLVEKIYLDALRNLTFTKTSTKPCMPISTGKITFILVPK